ncbi:MAG: Crp/Fnr family transcriptional regulator [Pseudomonadaceae bacterium]|nr:Crp/Fnr family transcriptional regulator [Pseudomonadaceae bacterium]
MPLTPANLSRQPLFSGLDEMAWARLAKAIHGDSFGKKGVLVRQGELHPYMYVILSGRAAMSRVSDSGGEVVTRLAGPGESLLEECVFLGTPSPMTVECEAGCQLALLPAATVHELVATCPTFARNIITALSQRSEQMAVQCQTLTITQAEDRLAGYMVQVMLEGGGPRQRFELPYTKATIAKHLGMTPETFSRTLKALAKRGVVVEGRAVTLTHLRALCHACDPSHARKCPDHGTAQCQLHSADKRT